MGKHTKIILLNGGKETREALRAGLGNMECTAYRTKHIALHITQGGDIRFFSNNEPIEWSDAGIFMRLRGSDQEFCSMLYDYFAFHKIPANDPVNRFSSHSAGKISQMLTLAQSKIPIPESFIFREESFEQNRTYLEAHISFPFVFKLDGSQGRNVFYGATKNELHSFMAGKTTSVRALLQPFIPNTFDSRTIIAYGEVLGTIARTRTKGYLNNIALGGKASAYDLTLSEQEIAKDACALCGIDVGGVDMIHTKEGPVVLEVNKSPQIKGFESVHGFKVFTRIGEILFRNAE